jgi:hypothetical protein
MLTSLKIRWLKWQLEIFRLRQKSKHKREHKISSADYQ